MLQATVTSWGSQIVLIASGLVWYPTFLRRRMRYMWLMDGVPVTRWRSWSFDRDKQHEYTRTEMADASFEEQRRGLKSKSG